MKNYKKPDGSIWSFEADGSQDHLITPDMTPISDAELAALRAPSFAQLKAMEFATFREQRCEFINRMTWVAADFSSLKTPDGDAAAANAQAVNRALLDMLTHASITSATDITALRLAMKTRYKAITGVAPAGMALPEVIASYRKVDA